MVSEQLSQWVDIIMFVYSYSSQTSLDKLLDINSKFRQYRSDMHPDPHILLVGVVGMSANKMSLCFFVPVPLSLSVCHNQMHILCFSLFPCR